MSAGIPKHLTRIQLASINGTLSQRQMHVQKDPRGQWHSCPAVDYRAVLTPRDEHPFCDYGQWR